MNTRKYFKMFGELADKKEIPIELYDFLIGEIAKNGGRMNKRIYGLYLTELEKRGLFFADGAPFTRENSAKTDGTYVYRHAHSPLRAAARAVLAGALNLIGYIAGGIGFGVWRIKDRKKLKGVPSYIAASNHIGYLDIVLSRRAAGGKRFYVVVAPHNRKNNPGGAILGAAAAIPLPCSLNGAKSFLDMLEYARDKKSVIHMYAEQSMWIGYRKIRPYKDGAFFYADMLGVPVVPMLYCYDKPNILRRILHLPKMTVRIGDPVYADTSLRPRERRTDMHARVAVQMRAMYESHYGKPLEYEKPAENPLT